MNHLATKITAAVIIAAAAFLAINSSWDDSFIVDEIPHVGAGYSYVTKGDYRLNPEHPPLAKDLAGLALLFLDINQSAFETPVWKDNVNDQWNFGRNLIFGSGNNAILITHVAKFPMLLFFVLSAIIIFVWTRKLYGNGAGLISVFLFSLSPTILAHSRFVTTDIPALFGVLLSSYFFIKYLEQPTRKGLWLAGISFGIAQLTKFSLILLVPYFIAVALMWAIAHRDIVRSLARTITVMAIGFIFVVWPVYYLHTMNYPAQRQQNDTASLLGSYGNKTLREIEIKAAGVPVIRAMAQYGLGLMMVSQRSGGGNTTYFMGEVRSQAWKEYFPIVYFIKEPLAFWILALVVFIGLGSRASLKWPRNIKDIIRKNFVEFALLGWLAIYWITSIQANLNIGVRHLMPVYGFTFILISGQISNIYQNVSKQKKIVLASTLVAILGWYAYENIASYPYYLAYFNQSAGGPAGGHRYVADSNLDWGQDLKRLSDWTDGSGIKKIYLDYFGWSDPYYYLKDKYVWININSFSSEEDFLSRHPEGGYIAISGTFLMQSLDSSKPNYLWLYAKKPTVVVGNSIFVWKVAGSR